MKRVIWKYKLEITGIHLPVGFEFVHLGEQGGEAYLWAIIDPTENDTDKCYVVGTGHPVEPDDEHIVSWQEPPYVWHLFREREK